MIYLPADHSPWERVESDDPVALALLNLSAPVAEADALDGLTADDRAIDGYLHGQWVGQGWRRELDRRTAAGGIDGLYEKAHGGGEEWAQQELTARTRIDPDVAARVARLKEMDKAMGRDTSDYQPRARDSWAQRRSDDHTARTGENQAAAEYAAKWRADWEASQPPPKAEALIPIAEDPRSVAAREEFLTRVDASELGAHMRAGMSNHGGRESVPAPGAPGSATYSPGAVGGQVVAFRFADGSPVSDADPMDWPEQFRTITPDDESAETREFLLRQHQRGFAHRSARETDLREQWRRDDRERAW